MFGVAPSFYRKNLSKVPVHINLNPAKVISKDILLDDEYNEAKEFHRAALSSYKNVDFQTICKIKVSTIYIMDKSVEDLFEKDLNYEIIKKIISSMWRWGYSRPKWNDVVDAYNGLRSFRFNKPDFSVRLDYTTWHNERGWSKFTRTYLDGVFAYLVYYKGVHVMTIGFSIASNNKILITQVQLKELRGNRWLYKMGSNYLEQVIKLFIQNFPKFTVYLVDGEDLVKKYIKDYENGLEGAKKSVITSFNQPNTAYLTSYFEDLMRLNSKIRHIKRDGPRLKAFYSNVGNLFKYSKPINKGGFRFYKVYTEGV